MSLVELCKNGKNDSRMARMTVDLESDDTMSLVELCGEGDLEGVKTALKSGADVNSKDEYGWTGLMVAVSYNHNSVVALLLSTPNIDVNLKSNEGWCALHWAVNQHNNEAVKLLLDVHNIDVNSVDYTGESALHQAVFNNHNSGVALLLNTTNIDVNQKNNKGWSADFGLALEFRKSEALKLLLNVPSIDVNIVDKSGWSAAHWAVDENFNNVVCLGDTIEGLKLLLSHPSLTSLTLNQKDNENGDTPVMLAMKKNGVMSHVVVVALAADPRVDLDTTDKEGRSLEEVARDPETRKVVLKAKQRRGEKRRMIREQQRQVSKVLLDGLYDPDSPISKLLGVRTEVVGEIIWQKLVENWQIFPEHMWC